MPVNATDIALVHLPPHPTSPQQLTPSFLISLTSSAPNAITPAFAPGTPGTVTNPLHYFYLWKHAQNDACGAGSYFTMAKL